MALIKHIAYSASLLLGCLFLSQVLFEAVPGDPARRILGPYASQESVVSLRKEMGLDRPQLQRITANILSALKLDFGHSIVDGRAVGPEVKEKLFRTFSLGFQAVLIASFLSLILLTVAHFFPQATILMYLLRAPSVLPSFLTAVLLGIAAALWLPTFISSSSRSIPAPFLPSLVAAVYPASVFVRTLDARWSSLRRSSLYRSSRALGFSRLQLLIRAILAPSASGILALVIGQLSVVLFASLVIEIIFSLPGLGMLMLTSIQSNDYPMLQGILIANAFVFIGLHFVAETLYPKLDPRIAR